MEGLIVNLDELLAEQEKKEAAIASAIDAFNAEQAAGRLGLEPYQRAKSLVAEHDALMATITLRIDEALASL